MMDARRLLEEGSERERALLRAGVDDAPTSESVQAAARVLGLVPRITLLAYGAALVAKIIKGTSVGGVWIAPVLVVGAVATTYLMVGHPSGSVRAPGATIVQPPRASAPAPTAAPSADPGAARAQASPSATEALPSRSAADLDSTSPGAAVSPRAATPTTASVRYNTADAVQQQVTLVDRARSLLASGDTGGALRAVDSYEHRFPHGVLAEEAALLRIQAVAARGDQATAAALAQRFRSAYPRSVHTEQVRLIDGSK